MLNNKVIFLAIAVVVGFCFGGPASSKWDTLFERCKSSDNQCLSKAIELAIKKLVPGIPSLGIPPLDPIEIKEMKIGAGPSAVHLDQNYKNLLIKGFKNVEVNETDFDLAKKTLKFITLHPQLEQIAEYEINGKILIAPVYGKGQSSIIIEKVSIVHNIQFGETEKSGEKYLEIDEYKAYLNVGHAKFNFENLFGGNKELGDNINKLLNDEWEAIYKDVKTGYEAAYSAVFKQFADKVFSKIPIKSLFL